MIFYLPTPKSPHGVDVDPTGEYIVAGGKLATVIPVHSFTKFLKSIEEKNNQANLRYSEKRIFQNELLHTLTILFEADFEEYL